jgi:mono/diheme cytochrome c family protein
MIRMASLLATFACWSAGVAPAAPPASSAADLVFFESRVRPLLVERCHACHSARAKKKRGGLLLDSRAGLLKGGDSGPVVDPARPETSLLLRAVRYANEALQMPPAGKLPPREIATLEEWVRRGAPMPEAGGPASGRVIDLAEGRKFWSFQPPRPVPPPAVSDSSWQRRRIDPFVLAAMEKRGLRPSPEARRRVLIRRASFDLVGLPPAPGDVESFVNDPDPAAYERLVERLLASPQYGERWGRFWLDLARYCDVGEPWSESKAQPWRYRDWVVRAFNDDLPYDQFVERQIAADLLPDAAPADTAALGFLGLSPAYWKELKLAPDVIKTVVAEEWEERVGALTGTFLGLTVACARCHDHKFDPITTQDYYALAGVLASTRAADRPLVPDAVAADVRRGDERVRALEEKIARLQAGKPLPPEASKQVADMKAAVEEIMRTQPHDMPLAPAVDDAGLFVLPDGPHKTKLEYRPGVAQDVAVQVRGNPASAGPVVPRRFLAVLSPNPPPPFRQGSGRLELARALVHEGAPLAARVIVNRVWKHHFGAGLVETPSDFGMQGARPSHPELLDDLAARFMAAGWSLKWLHREIVLSATYRQASGHDAGKSATDPDVRWLWRMPRRRLDVEAWRDAMLSVSGDLKTDQGGPPQDLGDARNHRRTLYGTVKRRELHDMLRLNDFPDPTAHSAARVPTTTPLQQLFVLNSPFVQRQAAALARRLAAEVPGGPEVRVRRAYALLFGRPPREGEVRRALDFLAGGKPTEAAWVEYAQVLLGSNEFLFID